MCMTNMAAKRRHVAYTSPLCPMPRDTLRTLNKNDKKANAS